MSKIALISVQLRTALAIDDPVAAEKEVEKILPETIEWGPEGEKLPFTVHALWADIVNEEDLPRP